MSNALAIGATGMQAQQINVDTISNNIANMTTTGFKRQRAEFSDLLYQNIQAAGSHTTDQGNIAPSGIQVGTGVTPVGIYRINEQGEMQNTGNKLDLAVQGRGYFQVLMPNGQTAYTRDGSFQLNKDGQMVNAAGYTTIPTITIPNTATDVAVNTSGEVYVTLPGNTTQQSVGQLQVATFINDAGLNSIGGNLYQETEASGTPTVGNPATDAFGTITQGYLESSNVNIVSEMTNLITAQRAYEMNSKVIQTANDMLSTLNNIK